MLRSSPSQWLQQRVAVVPGGITTKAVSLSVLYFVQGFPYGFQDKLIPLVLYMRGHSPSTVALTRLLLLPWLAKPLFAPLIDMWLTKVNWVTLSLSSLAAISFYNTVFVLSENNTGSSGSETISSQLVVTLFLLNFFSAFQDIAVDAVAIAILAGDTEVITGNVGQIVGYKLGAFFGSGILFWIYSLYGWRGLFGSLFLLYLLVIFVFIGSIQKLVTCDDVKHRKKIDDNYDDYGNEENDENDDDDDGKHLNGNGNQNCDGIPINETPTPANSEKEKEDEDEEEEEDNNDPNQWNQSKLLLSSLKWKTQQRKQQKQQRINNVFSCIINSAQCESLSSSSSLSLSSTMLNLICYLFVYKLGETAAMTTFPFFLLNQKTHNNNQIAFWNGTIGVVCSIFGSTIACKFSQSRLPSLVKLRLLPLLLQLLLLISCTEWWQQQQLWTTTTPQYTSIFYYSSILSLLLLQFIGGIITTFTFSLMMSTCQTMPESFRATRYTILSSVEVFGKLLFASLSGICVDWFGFGGAQLLYLLLSIIPLWCLESLTTTTTTTTTPSSSSSPPRMIQVPNQVCNTKKLS